jgi:hypothetical protein
MTGGAQPALPQEPRPLEFNKMDELLQLVCCHGNTVNSVTVIPENNNAVAVRLIDYSTEPSPVSFSIIELSLGCSDGLRRRDINLAHLE